MKFNFEKVKNIAKKGVVLSGAALISVSPLEKEQNSDIANDINNSKNIENNFTINNIGEFKDFAKFPTIEGFYEAEEKFQGDKENVILLEDISNLENQFSKLSKEKAKIDPGSFAIVSRLELRENGVDDEYSRKIGNSGTTQFSSLNNKYITDLVTSAIEDSTINNTNNKNNTKIYNTDFSSRQKVSEMKDVAEYMDVEYQYYRPEYYFVIDQSHNEDTIKFKLKVISSKDSKVIEEFVFDEKPPEGDMFEDNIMDDFIEKDVVPKIVQKIQEKMHEYQLDTDKE